MRTATAQAERANADRRRYDNLVASGAVGVRDADTYPVAAIGAEQDVARVSALFDVSRDSAAMTRSKRAMFQTALQKADAATRPGGAQALCSILIAPISRSMATDS